MIKPKKLAIVGGGPRGLAALESIYCSLVAKGIPTILNTQLFEAHQLPGAGHVYDISQPDTNWLNFSQRALTLAKRDGVTSESLAIPEFPSFHDWSGYSENKDSGQLPDTFPLRSTLGKYLNERFESIATVLKKAQLLEVILIEVKETEWKNDSFTIIAKDGTEYNADELVLTIGHQPTKPSEQMAQWMAYNSEHTSLDLFTEAYPVESVLRSTVLSPNSVVALRGFGLAMIDMMRALTIGLGGKFRTTDASTKALTYVKSGQEPFKIIPFSLDGLPMSPKPLNSEIDHWFLPTESEKEIFGNQIRSIAKEGETNSHLFVIEAIAPIVLRVFKDLRDKADIKISNDNKIISIIIGWLSDGDFQHSLLIAKSVPPLITMKSFIGMATGTKSASLDFCIGQVWRHCQPILYKSVSFSNLEDDVIADIIALDERLKRYSYGPPVESLQQLLALVDAEILDLKFVDNPIINTTEKGWKLTKNNDEIVANMMVNSVLDPAKLLEMDSPIVRHLLEDSLVKPVHGELGIKTKINACVQLAEDELIPLAVLGRLSKGTIIGVDAVLQCFEDRADYWSNGVIERIGDPKVR